MAEIKNVQSRKSGSRIGIMPIFIFALVAGFISLFWFVRPAPAPIPTPVQFTPFASNYTPPPRSLQPKPDPNGGRIVFTCTRRLQPVCTINRDGFTQLSDMEASNYYPVFPDGSALLFASNRNGPFDLYLLLFGEKQLFQITDNVGNVVSPDYSPDGRRIVFANQAGDGPHPFGWSMRTD
jgi:dipeptidyl aminopeptidase/acylaminoacyl peptidase